MAGCSARAHTKSRSLGGGQRRAGKPRLHPRQPVRRRIPAGEAAVILGAHRQVLCNGNGRTADSEATPAQRVPLAVWLDCRRSAEEGVFGQALQGALAALCKLDATYAGGGMAGSLGHQ